MTQPRPTASTLTAIIEACDRTIVAAAIPRGHWLTFDAKLPGYDVSQLLLVFDDRSSLNLWSDSVRYGSEPFHEAFVLQAELLGARAEPLTMTNLGATSGFAIAPPLQSVFATHRLKEPTLFVELTDLCIFDESDYLTSDSLRLLVGESYVDFMTEGMSVMSLSLVLRSTAFPEFNTQSTGKRELLSSTFGPKRQTNID